MGDSPAIACSLTSEELPERLAQAQLLGRSLLDVETNGARATLRFDGDDATRSEVERFVSLESSCCPFFEFDVRGRAVRDGARDRSARGRRTDAARTGGRPRRLLGAARMSAARSRLAGVALAAFAVACCIAAPLMIGALGAVGLGAAFGIGAGLVALAALCLLALRRGARAARRRC